MWFPNRSDTNRAVHAQKMVAAKLICVFVFAYADCCFSYEVAKICFYDGNFSC